jgi:DNA-binding NarL/FixJ family response regulator
MAPVDLFSLYIGIRTKDHFCAKIAEMLDKTEKNTAAQGEIEAITILLADDHPLVRQALKNLLETQPDMKVIGEAANGEEAVKLAKELHPSVVIMDIGMPVMNGLEATRHIKTQNPNIAILVLTVHTDKEHVIGILDAGAAGYLTKVVFGDDVIRAIQAIVAGEAVLTPSILQQILKVVPREAAKPVVLPPGLSFTPREQVILKLAARGLSNKDIALELSLSVRTVKAHLVDLFSKIGVGSRTEAVVTGLKMGFLTLNDLG